MPAMISETELWRVATLPLRWFSADRYHGFLDRNPWSRGADRGSGAGVRSADLRIVHAGESAAFVVDGQVCASLPTNEVLCER